VGPPPIVVVVVPVTIVVVVLPGSEVLVVDPSTRVDDVVVEPVGSQTHATQSQPGPQTSAPLGELASHSSPGSSTPLPHVTGTEVLVVVLVMVVVVVPSPPSLHSGG